MAPIDVDAPLSAATKKMKKETDNKFKSSPKHKFTKNFVKKSNILKPSLGLKRGKKSVRFSDELPVRINISNLASTINTSDLRELFNEYNVENVSVNSDQNGLPTGTGDITVSEHVADRLVHDFKGVSIDDKELNFSVIGKKGILNRVSLPNGKMVRFGACHQKPSKAKKTKKETPMKMTVEQLDAELDAYMNNA